jgi:TonB family protein
VNVRLEVPASAVWRQTPATIHYSLDAPVSAVTLEILDAKGRVVTTYSSRSGEIAEELPERDGMWQPLRTTAGRHSFTWNLRHACGIVYPGLEREDELRKWQPWVAPGAYQVRLTVGGRAATQPLVVALDPAVNDVTHADLDAQFEFSLGLCNKRSAALGAVFRIRDRDTAIRGVLAASRNTTLTGRGEALLAKLANIETAIYRPAAQDAPAPGAASVPWCDRLAALQREVLAEDRQPTAVARATAAALESELDELLRALTVLERDEGDAFERLAGPGGQAGPTIQFDPRGVEFGPWIRRFTAQVKRNWAIPYDAMAHKGEVTVTFSVRKSGQIEDVSVTGPSRVEAFNKSSRQAIESSNPTYPLPAQYPADHAVFNVTFYYNTKPR